MAIMAVLLTPSANRRGDALQRGGARPVLVRGRGGGGFVPLHVRGPPGDLLRRRVEKVLYQLGLGCACRLREDISSNLKKERVNLSSLGGGEVGVEDTLQ